MRTHTCTAICVLALATISGLAHAQSATDALGRCLADNTTGKDRKDLARWIFSAMASHPDMKPLSAVTTADLDAVSRTAGGLFTRLLADTCPKEAKAAMDSGGTAAIQTGFQVLGQLAMQELMTNPQVGASMTVLERHIDKGRIDAALKPR